MPKQTSDKEFTFEDAVSELEEIVVSMEEDQLPLQELVDKFERGARLHKDCESFLNSAKKRLETIAKETAEEPAQSAQSTPQQSPSTDDDEIRLF